MISLSFININSVLSVSWFLYNVLFEQDIVDSNLVSYRTVLIIMFCFSEILVIQI